MAIGTRTQMVMPPDAGSTNNGTAAVVGQCGRGIQRTGDIRHVGDISGGKLQTITLTPGTNAEQVTPDSCDAVGAGLPQGASTTQRFGLDGGMAFNGASSAYCGGDASGEGFDGYSSKKGMEN